MGLFVAENSNAFLDNRQFSLIGGSDFPKVSAIFHRYGSIVQDIVGNEISFEQVRALRMLSFMKIMTLYVNLPNSKGSSFFGLSDAVASGLISRYPVFQQSMDKCLEIRRQLENWNPTFAEAALLASFLYFNGYKGKNNRIICFQKTLENCCKMRLWQLSCGDYDWFERRWNFFQHVSELLDQAKTHVFHCMEKLAMFEDVFGSVSSGLAHMEMQGEMILDAKSSTVDEFIQGQYNY